jgi:hypothetical protein
VLNIGNFQIFKNFDFSEISFWNFFSGGMNASIGCFHEKHNKAYHLHCVRTSRWELCKKNNHQLPPMEDNVVELDELQFHDYGKAMQMVSNSAVDLGIVVSFVEGPESHQNYKFILFVQNKFKLVSKDDFHDRYEIFVNGAFIQPEIPMTVQNGKYTGRIDEERCVGLCVRLRLSNSASSPSTPSTPSVSSLLPPPPPKRKDPPVNQSQGASTLPSHLPPLPTNGHDLAAKRRKLSISDHSASAILPPLARSSSADSSQSAPTSPPTMKSPPAILPQPSPSQPGPIATPSPATSSTPSPEIIAYESQLLSTRIERSSQQIKENTKIIQKLQHMNNRLQQLIRADKQLLTNTKG